MKSLALSFALLVGPLSSLTRAAEPPPNFVIILADDLGYGDLGCYGSKTIATPRLDRMAKEGLRFTDAYAASPFCSPSRAGLLTGRLPARCGLPYVLFPPEHHGLPTAEITLAELLKPRGYATACIGKWHLGWDAPFRPARQGFDVFFGLPYPNNFAEWKVGAPFTTMVGLQPLPLFDGDKIIEAPVDQALLTQRYTERAVAFIRERKDRPTGDETQALDVSSILGAEALPFALEVETSLPRFVELLVALVEGPGKEDQVGARFGVASAVTRERVLAGWRARWAQDPALRVGGNASTTSAAPAGDDGVAAARGPSRYPTLRR